MVKRCLLAALVTLLFPAVALAAAAGEGGPKWSLELKGGAFFPDVPGWSRSYGSSYLGEYGGALAYKVMREVEIGIGGTYSTAKGKAIQPLHNRSASDVGEVTFRRLPLDLYVLGRLVVDEKQWLVPYAGGGYTRLFYRAGVKGQDSREGSVNGFHGRGGIQFLLDRLEPEAATSVREDFGLDHTYFFIEGNYLRAMADTVSGGAVNLGGASCLGGFLFEF